MNNGSSGLVLPRRRALVLATAGNLLSTRFMANAKEPPSSSSGEPGELLRPPRLRPGDTVGLITPGTPVVDPDDIAVARSTMQRLGFSIKLAPRVNNRATMIAHSL